MAEPNEPKKETVRITLPAQPVAGAAGNDHDTVQLDPPSRVSAMETPPRSVPAATPSTAATSAPKPAPAPPGPSVLPPGRIVPAPPTTAHSASPQPPVAKTPTPRPPVPGIAAAPASAAIAAPPGQPKKETARIAMTGQPPKAAPMRKTQPLVTLTATPLTPPVAPVKVAPPAQPRSAINSIPMPLCWALLAISAIILLIEIWNYIS